MGSRDDEYDYLFKGKLLATIEFVQLPAEMC